MTEPLQPGGVRYWGDHGGPVDAYDDFEPIKALLNPSRVALVMLVNRIGVRSFITFLEYTYFPPDTPLNQHFRMALANWGGMRWVIVIIHKRHLEKADRLAKLVGLRRADGVPHVIHSGEILEPGSVGAVAAVRKAETLAKRWGLAPGMKVETFPLDGPNVWVMENIAGHFTYASNSLPEQMSPEHKELERKARAFEDQACDQLIEEHRRKYLAGEFKHEPGTQPPKRL